MLLKSLLTCLFLSFNDLLHFKMHLFMFRSHKNTFALLYDGCVSVVFSLLCHFHTYSRNLMGKKWIISEINVLYFTQRKLQVCIFFSVLNWVKNKSTQVLKSILQELFYYLFTKVMHDVLQTSPAGFSSLQWDVLKLRGDERTGWTVVFAATLKKLQTTWGRNERK